MIRSILLAGVACLSVAAVAAPALSAEKAPPAGAAAARTQHFDTSAMDRTVNPGDSFFRFANGTWDKTTEIPADKSAYSSFAALQDRVNEQVHTVLEDAAKANAPRGSVQQKVGDFYSSFMNEAAIEARGLEPLKPDLARIDALATKSDLARLIGTIERDNVSVPFELGVTVDARQNDRYIVDMEQGGLGLPDRDAYLDEANPRFADIRTKYQQHIVNMLKLAGYSEPEMRAQRIMDLEKKIAAVHWTRLQRRDPEKTYNPMSPADLAANMPGFDWPAFLAAAGISGQSSLVVGQPSAIAGTAKLVSSEPLDAWKDYLAFRTLSSSTPVLPKAFVDEYFNFYGKTLSGTPQLPARWKQGLSIANGAIGQAVGQLYVARYFPPETKAKADRLVRNLISAMDKRLANLTWMTPETKVKARAKLAAFNPKIGYPDKWRDYSQLEIVPGDAFGNLRRAANFEYQRQLGNLGKPVDRTEWFMTPQTVNAYANPRGNEVVFPAAHLQPPFFDPNADEASNYGGIGIGIGHEISHHFDDQGRKFDPKGNLADWWTPTDVAQFKKLTDQLVAQYSEYEPLPGQKVNGALTLGENIADLAGLAIAYDAYRMALNGKPAPVIDGFTGDQRFFLGFAQVWRAKYRDSLLQQLLKTDVHTPSHLRSNAVRNVDAWYKAFDVKDGALYLPPEKRIRIW